MLEALNVLGKTQWCVRATCSSPLLLSSATRHALRRRARRINDDVLVVLEKVWEAGGGVAGIPARDDVPLPRTPSPCFTLHSTGVQLLCFGSKPMARVFASGARCSCVLISHAAAANAGA